MKSLFFAAAMLPVLLLSGCGSKPIEAPATYEEFVAIDKSFAGVGPSGWEKGEFGAGDTYAKTAFTNGADKIEIKSDTASSFLGGIMAMGGKKPVDAIHERALTGMTTDKGDGFTPQTTQNIQGAFGDSRYTEWKQNGTHGVRLTAMMPERSLSIESQCPEADWPVVKDVTWKIWSSLKAAKQ